MTTDTVNEDLKPFEEWAAAKKTPAWLLACATGYYSWPVGRQMTEADFDRCISAAGNLTILAS